MSVVLELRPYRCEQTEEWAFDDPSVGLAREPFVMGASQMMSELVEAERVTNARAGFRLLFSPRPFPGHQRELMWKSADSGGNWYFDPATGMAGWLCPALFKYFEGPPDRLYVRVEGLS